jgi:hypothetical protein
LDRFKSDYHSVIVAFFASLFKKKMEKIEGVYVGQERQVRMYGSITDTTWDSVYDQIITVKLYEKD